MREGSGALENLWRLVRGWRNAHRALSIAELQRTLGYAALLPPASVAVTSHTDRVVQNSNTWPVQAWAYPATSN